MSDVPQQAPRTSHMTASSAQICRDLGWQAGDVLESQSTHHDGISFRRLRLTAIGETLVLAVLESVL